MSATTELHPRRFQHKATGKVYHEICEAFSHPEQGHEGRIDLVLRASDDSLATLPLSSVTAELEPLESEAQAPLNIAAAKCFRHFKGKFYQELGRATSLVTGGEEVVYRTLYASAFQLFTRPRANFESEAAGGQPRFQPVTPDVLDADAQARVLSSFAPAASNGKVALVTGASQGLGRAAAQALAKVGFIVFAGARGEQELGVPRVVPLSMDVRDEGSVRSVFGDVMERAGRLDVLVNNAGVLVVGTVEMVSLAQSQELFQTNLFGAMHCMQEALCLMRAQGSGRIVNVSTIFSEIPTMNQPIYAASKAALDSLTLGTREAVKPFGISVQSLQPGGITDTSIGANLKNGDRLGKANPYPIDDMVKDSVFDRIVPHGQTSEEVAAIIVDMALGRRDEAVVQSSDYTRGLAAEKLKDVTGEAVVAMKF